MSPAVTTLSIPADDAGIPCITEEEANMSVALTDSNKEKYEQVSFLSYVRSRLHVHPISHSHDAVHVRTHSLIAMI